MPRTSHPLLSIGELNRATLARQLLLRPARVAAVAAIERIGGLQAQEPASPYLGLWTRLESFDAATLDAAFRDRSVVKATLMRSTLHAVSREDYLRMLPATQPMLRGLNRRGQGAAPDADRLAALAESALAFTVTPRTNTELREYLAGVATDLDPDDALWFVRRYATFIHAPADTRWTFGRRPVLASAPAWLDGAAFAAEEDALEHVVRRYLGAFGPASAADLSAWSGLPVARFRPAIATVDAAGDLVRFSDERGRELLDIAGAPRPAADVDAPPRLLPMWDSVLLAFADRTRLLTDEHRRVVIARNGDTLPAFLVDGRVAGLWWAEADGRATKIVLEPFGRLPAAARRELVREGERLAAFVAPLEPDVYRRYRWSRARVQ